MSMSAEREALQARVVAAARKASHVWADGRNICPNPGCKFCELKAALEALEALEAAEAQEKPKYEALQGYEGDSRLWRVVCGGWLVCVFFRDDAEYAAHAYASRLNGVGRDTASERHAGHHEALRRLAFTDGVQRGLSAAVLAAETRGWSAFAAALRALSAEAVAREAQPKEREA